MAMTTMEALALYAGLCLLLMLALGFRVSLARTAAKASLGDAGDERLTLAIRAHANLTEYMPAFFVGLLLAAQFGAPILTIHVLGGGFTAARVLHALGMTTARPNPARFIGALATYLLFLLLGAGLIVHAVL